RTLTRLISLPSRAALVLPRRPPPPSTPFPYTTLFRSFEGHGNEAGVTIRPQPQVDIVKTTGRRHGREPRHHAAAQFDIAFDSVIVRVVIEKDQVQIGGIADLLAAQLAIGNHHERGLLRDGDASG